MRQTKYLKNSKIFRANMSKTKYLDVDVFIFPSSLVTIKTAILSRGAEYTALAEKGLHSER